MHGMVPTAENRLMHHRPEPLQRHRSSAKSVRAPVLAVAALLAFTGACAQEDPAGEAIFTPELIGTAALPLSESDAVSLLADERMACVADSYETRVRCVDVEGAVVGVFGRKGEGPGEFDSPAHLARGEDGTVGVLDVGLGRFTVFEPSGAYVSEVRVPMVDVPLRSFGTVLSGVEADVLAMFGGETAISPLTRHDVNIVSGEILREEASPGGPWDVACGQIISGIPDRAGGWVLLACEGQLIFVGGTGEATMLRAPTYNGELPNERDVARQEESLMAFQMSLGRPAAGPVVEEALERYRARPKNYHLGTEPLVDAANRYWIATQRDTHEWSWLDVYQDAEYAGSVRVRDRLRGFDLLGSTLVVLVERQVGPNDADGIPDRALDWYDLGDRELGR